MVIIACPELYYADCQDLVIAFSVVDKRCEMLYNVLVVN